MSPREKPLSSKPNAKAEEYLYMMLFMILEEAYIELLESPVDLLGSKSDGILVLIIGYSSLVQTRNGALREFV